MDWAGRIFDAQDIPAAYESGGEGVVFDEDENEQFLGYVQDLSLIHI